MHAPFVDLRTETTLESISSVSFDPQFATGSAAEGGELRIRDTGMRRGGHAAIGERRGIKALPPPSGPSSAEIGNHVCPRTFGNPGTDLGPRTGGHAR